MLRPRPARTLTVIDATAQVHRGWHGLARGRGADEISEPEAVQAVAAVLGKLLCSLQPRYLIAAFDSGRSHRRTLDPSYKAHRPEPSPGLAKVLSLGPEIARALGCLVVQQEGYEADDLLACAAARGRSASLDVVLVSQDKDVCQVVGDGVWRADPKTLELEDPAGVHRRLGVWPHQVCDFLSLVGDSSDGIAGVPGVGPKTAAGLLTHAGSLSAIYRAPEHAMEAEVRGARSAVTRIVEHREQVRLAWRLVRLRIDSDLGCMQGLTLGSLRPKTRPELARRLGLEEHLLRRVERAFA